MWVPDISHIEGPRYLALARAINEAIDLGALPPGAQLPPQRDLAKELNVTVGTVGRAYKIIRERRLVSSEVGRGTFVRGADEEGYSSFLPYLKPGTIDLALFGSNPVGLSEALSSALVEVSNGVSLMPMNRYPIAKGYPTHCTAGATWISISGYEPPPNRVLVLNGVQQGIMAVILALGNGPEEEILCEKVTYSGLKALSVVLDRRLHGIEMDEFGIIPAAVEDAVEKTGSLLLYVQPTVQNPTGAAMPIERRREIADIAKRHDLTIIEDDASVGGMRDRPAPIASLAPDNVVYLTGFAKCISPALRAGFLAAPARYHDRISSTIHAMALANSPIIGDIAATLINRGTAETLASQHYEALGRAHEAAREILADIPHSSHPAGNFIWVPLPEHWTSLEFVDAALKVGVSIIPSNNHTASGLPPRAFRIAINPAQKPDVFAEGIAKLKALMNERARPLLAV
ncbi:MAG: PLP-dependent aminotransferase family protein [Nitratireductor sp.]|nr:PLP-dependent aminotransferase family protein [Nitratireductor sp.]MCC0021409.1 PLP-dependent aminotransferase family protein [Nitratireductor sp.]